MTNLPGTTISPLYVNGDFPSPWKPEFPFPHYNENTPNFFNIGKLASEIYKFESVENDKANNNKLLLYYRLTLSAFGSGELTTKNKHEHKLFYF